MTPELQARIDDGELRLRRWSVADMEGLCAEMAIGYPYRGLHPPGPRDEVEASEWLAVQDAGWAQGDWLSWGVFEHRPQGGPRVVGQVAVKAREVGPPVAECVVGEVSYWTAVSARGRGIAPAALDALSRWAFDTFPAEGLRELMAVHDVDNPASCRAAEKSGYAFQRLSPANPPLWFTDGHIHTRFRAGAHPHPEAI